MQICFTHKTSLLLTTDGRVFSWGDKDSPTLGTGAEAGVKEDEKALDESQSASGSNLGKEELADLDILYEVQITNKKGRATITHIAAGRNHVLALDSSGAVYSWGIDKFGQLGQGWESKQAKETKEAGEVIKVTKPTLIGGNLSSHEVAQIFAGDK